MVFKNPKICTAPLRHDIFTISMRSGECRERAFEQFKKVAARETRDFVYNMAYRRLVPQFSTAPQSETERDIRLIEDMAKLGHAEAAIQVGEELYGWAEENGYSAPSGP